MQKNHYNPTLASLIAALASVTPISTALAQTNAVLQEIVVTAQKREESLGDVPISVSVLSAERLDTANMNRIADITEFVPNLSSTETGISTQLYIRGIGSGNNQAFEQSVGQYIDGIYYGRQQMIRAPFLDLERIEVLRGPQSTLFGKNSIAGALNMTTARPTEEFDAALYGIYEFESAQQEYTGHVSGPLSDNVRARLAFRHYEEDGYMRNSFKNQDEPQREEQALRLTLDWDISDNLDATLKVERNNFDTVGRAIEIALDQPNLFPAGSTPIAGLNFAQIQGAFGQPAMESTQNFVRQSDADESNDSSMDNLTLNLNYQWGNKLLTMITGFVEYDFQELCDCDYSPATIFEVRLEEDYEQFSQEIRLASDTTADLQWVLGGYYQESDMVSLEAFDIPTNSMLNTLAATSPDPDVQLLSNISGTSAERDNSQSSELWAIFAQGTWQLSDTLRLTAGGRYTEEKKDAFRQLNILDTATGNVTANPLAPFVYLGAFDVYSAQTVGLTPFVPGIPLPGHTLSGERKESQFTPLLNVQWDINDQTMLYASATRGYKSGGFDARANNPFSFEFEEEETTSLEVGAKNTLLNNALELNVAIFLTDYDDLQISQFDGSLGFNVGNAANTEVRGIELDGRLALSETLLLSYAYAWLDFEFQDFENGNCYNRQTPDSISPTGTPLCDFSGARGQYTPEHSLSLALDYNRPLNNRLDLFGNLSMNYVGKQNVHDNLDPNFLINSTTRVNLKVGIATEQWSLAFIGRNLTDESVITYASNLPISATSFGTNTFAAFMDRPRQLAVEAGYHF